MTEQIYGGYDSILKNAGITPLQTPESLRQAITDIVNKVGPNSGTYVATISYVGPPTYTGSKTGQAVLDTGGTTWQWNGTTWISDLSAIVAAVALGG
jgi:hypothetical protein